MDSASFWLLVASTAGVVIICYLIINLVKTLHAARQLAKFPSAPSSWLTGHLKYLQDLDGAARLQFHVRCATEFKTCYAVWRTSVTGILALCHPDTIKVMQSSNAPKGDTYRFSKPFFGDGLIASNGDKWFRMRRLLTPAFHFEILKSYVKVFQDSTNVLLDKWSAQERGEVELFHHVSLMTLDSILKCALSYKSNCQTQENDPYIKAVYAACDAIVRRVMNPLLYSDTIYKMTPGAKKFAGDCSLTQAKAKEVIKERRAALQDTAEQEKLKKKKRLDFLDILLAARDEDGNGLSEEEITSEVMTFMFAGHDTTASSISWTLYNLARFPEHQEKCREEIDEVLGNNEEFEWNDLGKLKYVHLCIKESNRLYSVVSQVSRLLEKPYEIDGKLVPKGTMVASQIFALHRNPHV
ncbi:cytochrome P450 4F3-like [Oculina patagonica]